MSIVQTQQNLNSPKHNQENQQLQNQILYLQQQIGQYQIQFYKLVQRSDIEKVNIDLNEFSDMNVLYNALDENILRLQNMGSIYKEQTLEYQKQFEQLKQASTIQNDQTFSNFNAIIQDLNQKVDFYNNEIDQQNNILCQKENLLSEGKVKLDNTNYMLQDLNDQLKSEVNRNKILNDQLQQQKTQSIKQIQDIEKKLKNQIKEQQNSFKKQFDDQNNESISKIQTLRQTISQKEQIINDNIKIVQQNKTTIDKITKEKTENIKIIQKIQQDLAQEKEQNSIQINDLKNEYQQIINDIKNEDAKTIETLKTNSLNNVTKITKDMEVEKNNLINDYTKQINQISMDKESQIAELLQKNQDKVYKIQQEKNSKENELNRQVTNFNQEINNKNQNIQRLDQKIQALNEQVKMDENFFQQQSSNFKTVSLEQEQIILELQNENNRLTLEIKNINNQILSLQDKIAIDNKFNQQQLEQNQKSFQIDFENQKKSFEMELETHLQHQYDNFQDEKNDLQANTNSLFIQSEQKYQNQINQQQKEYQNIQDQLINDYEKQINEKIILNQEQKTDYKIDKTKLIQEYENKIQEIKTENENNIQRIKDDNKNVQFEKDQDIMKLSQEMKKKEFELVNLNLQNKDFNQKLAELKKENSQNNDQLSLLRVAIHDQERTIIDEKDKGVKSLKDEQEKHNRELSDVQNQYQKEIDRIVQENVKQTQIMQKEVDMLSQKHDKQFNFQVEKKIELEELLKNRPSKPEDQTTIQNLHEKINSQYSFYEQNKKKIQQYQDAMQYLHNLVHKYKNTYSIISIDDIPQYIQELLNCKSPDSSKQNNCLQQSSVQNCPTTSVSNAFRHFSPKLNLNHLKPHLYTQCSKISSTMTTRNNITQQTCQNEGKNKFLPIITPRKSIELEDSFIKGHKKNNLSINRSILRNKPQN